LNGIKEAMISAYHGIMSQLVMHGVKRNSAQMLGGGMQSLMPDKSDPLFIVISSGGHKVDQQSWSFLVQKFKTWGEVQSKEVILRNFNNNCDDICKQAGVS
jgi:hypothetical protein